MSGVGPSELKHDQPIGLAYRQLPEKDLIHQREDAGVRADSQCQRDDGGRSEAGRAPELAQGVAQILKNSGHCFISVLSPIRIAAPAWDLLWSPIAQGCRRPARRPPPAWPSTG